MPEPAGDLGEGHAVVHDAAVLRTRGVHLPRGDRPGGVRERRARRGRADPPVGRLQPGHLQVRARGRVHQRAAGAAHDGPRLGRADLRARRRRRAA